MFTRVIKGHKAMKSMKKYVHSCPSHQPKHVCSNFCVHQPKVYCKCHRRPQYFQGFRRKQCHTYGLNPSQQRAANCIARNLNMQLASNGSDLSSSPLSHQSHHLAYDALVSDIEPSHQESLSTVLQSPQQFQASLPRDSSFLIIWDSGASISISPDVKDFVGPLQSPAISTRICGIS